jgi:hypothetical protein
MVFICKLYANGKPEQTVTFDTLLGAEKWAGKHARVVESTGTGWDTRYTVYIYGDVDENADLLNIFPLKVFIQ